MKTYRISYVFLLLMTGILWMHNPIPVYTAAFLAAMLLPVLSGAAFLLSKKKFEKAKASMDPEKGNGMELHCKEAAALKVRVNGASSLWTGRVEAVLKIRNLFTGETETQKISLFTEKNGFAGITELHPESCGCLEITLCEWKALDITGIWSCRLPLYAEACVYVFPVSGKAVGSNRPRSVLCSKNMSMKGKMTEEIKGFRKYMPGDQMNWIHWKLSAKTGELLLKTFEHHPEEEILLLLDLRGSKALAAEEKNEILGNLLEASRALMLKKRTHWIGSVSAGRIWKFPVVNAGTQRTAFKKLLRLPADLEEAPRKDGTRKDWKCPGNVVYLFTEKRKIKTGG